MSDLASEPLHDELRRHASALRTLARDLLRDPHAADDVTQATLQEALRRQGDLRPGPLGGWLTRTLVNFVHQWRG
ncbi:MAG: sigma factor, partial [Planctomycetota bacterium]